jgi:hypothetical protein
MLRSFLLGNRSNLADGPCSVVTGTKSKAVGQIPAQIATKVRNGYSRTLQSVGILTGITPKTNKI